MSGFSPREKGTDVGTESGSSLDRGRDWRELSEAEYEIWELLPKRGGIGIDILCQKTGRSRLDLLAQLSELRLTGFATSSEGLWLKNS